MHKILTLLDKICQPDPECYPDELQRQIQFRRNKSFLVLSTTTFFLVILYVLVVKWPARFIHYWSMSAIFGSILIFCLVCRSRPTLYKVLYAVFMLIGGPICIYYDNSGIFGCWASVLIFPKLLLFFANSRFYYALQIGVHLLLLNFIYKDEMIETFNALPSHLFAEKLTRVTNLAVIANTIMAFGVNETLENAFKSQLVLEGNKRRELEGQKTFILSFSHEIRNLINILVGNIQLSLLEKLQPKVKNLLEDAESGASLLLQMISNILDTGNIDVGELDINPTPGTIHNTLEKMWRICAYLLKSRGLKAQLRILKKIPRTIKLDHGRLIQIFTNLIVNAVKFTHQGSVDVKIEWVEGATTVTDESFTPSPFDDENEGVFEKDQALSILGNNFTIVGLEKKTWSSDRYNFFQGSGQGLLKISVTDTGCGVNEDDLPYVFNRFKPQIFGDKCSSRLGNAIGLHITKELCQRMRGDIKIFSKPERGTSFIVCIPAEQVLTEDLQEMSICRLEGESYDLKVMIVDDLSFNITVLSNYFERLKVEVSNTARNGQEAYEKYVDSVRTGNKFDIVTMDVEMPVMDGKEAAQKIREYERENNLSPCLLVMISGNCCESEISQCLKYEGGVLANHFIRKPAIFDDISRIVAQFFQAHTLIP